MAFIGAGKMAEAILGGLPPVNWDNTYACDYSEARVRVFRERFGIKVVPNKESVVKDADVVSVQKTAHDGGRGLVAADTCDYCFDAAYALECSTHVCVLLVLPPLLPPALPPAGYSGCEAPEC